MATQGERRAETRQRLLDAAAELFAERGIEGASIDASASRAASLRVA
jgi:AcrR family transcriptional regulator